MQPNEPKLTGYTYTYILSALMKLQHKMVKMLSNDALSMAQSMNLQTIH